MVTEEEVEVEALLLLEEVKVEALLIVEEVEVEALLTPSIDFFELFNRPLT